MTDDFAAIERATLAYLKSRADREHRLGQSHSTEPVMHNDIRAAINAYRAEPSDEDVERVARAICEDMEEDPDATDTPYEIRGWRLYRSTARAAIAALRAKR